MQHRTNVFGSIYEKSLMFFKKKKFHVKLYLCEILRLHLSNANVDRIDLITGL
jgi:hypothetical protein